MYTRSGTPRAHCHCRSSTSATRYPKKACHKKPRAGSAPAPGASGAPLPPPTKKQLRKRSSANASPCDQASWGSPPKDLTWARAPQDSLHCDPGAKARSTAGRTLPHKRLPKTSSGRFGPPGNQAPRTQASPHHKRNPKTIVNGCEGHRGPQKQEPWHGVAKGLDVHGHQPRGVLGHEVPHVLPGGPEAHL